MISVLSLLNFPHVSPNKRLRVPENFVDDRGHVIEKSKNQRTGDQEETQEYINIEEGKQT